MAHSTHSIRVSRMHQWLKEWSNRTSKFCYLYLQNISCMWWLLKLSAWFRPPSYFTWSPCFCFCLHTAAKVILLEVKWDHNTQNPPVVSIFLRSKSQVLKMPYRAPQFLLICPHLFHHYVFELTYFSPFLILFHLPGFLSVSWTCQIFFCLRTFALAVPSAWNTLSPSISTAQTASFPSVSLN